LLVVVSGLGPGCGSGEATTPADGPAAGDAHTPSDGGVGGPDRTQDGSIGADAPESEAGSEDGPPAVTRPVAGALSISVEVGSLVSGMLPAAPVPGRALTYTIGQMPRTGTITAFNAETGAFSYQETGLVAGADAFEFQVSDGQSVSDPARVDIAVK